jgi:MFS family permease
VPRTPRRDSLVLVNKEPAKAVSPPSDRWLIRGVLGIGLASLLSDWGHEAATALLPVLLAGLGAPAFALGVIEGVADGLSSFSKLFSGWIADRPAWRKPVAASGYLIVAFSTFGYAFAQSWPVVLVLRALGWIGRGGKGPSKDALLVDCVDPAALGRAFGFERAMDTLGAVIGPLFATALVAISSERVALRWTLLPGLLAALAFTWLVPSGRQPRHYEPVSFFSSLRRLPPRFRHFLAGVLVFGLGDFAHTLLILRAAQILASRYGAARAGALAVMLYTLHNIVYAAASYPAGALGDRIGKRGLLAVGYALAAVMNVGFLFGPANLPALGVLFGLGGLYVAMHDGLEKSLGAELLPGEIRGTGFGVLATVNGIGDFASSIVVGFLWSSAAPAAGFLYAAALTLAGAFLIYRWR